MKKKWLAYAKIDKGPQILVEIEAEGLKATVGERIKVRQPQGIFFPATVSKVDLTETYFPLYHVSIIKEV